VLVDLGNFSVLLRQTRIAGRWRDDSATGIVEGLMTGFVTDAVARRVRILPAELGGPLIIDLLSGSDTHRCDDPNFTANDRDVGPDGAGGWWFYWAFDAERVDWSE
jgi:hypothetical protein